MNGHTENAEIAFFGGSFTAIERGYMESLLQTAAPFVKDKTFAGIRISTRPDAIDDEILTLLKNYGVSTIELGAQSMDDHVLKLNHRGHTVRQVEVSSQLIKEYGFTLGLQMMTGLYGDTIEGAIETAHKIAALKPQCVRIYPTIIMKGTELGEKFRAGEFETLGLSESVDLCADLLDFFDEQGISVIRLGLHSSPELESGMLSGPWHPAFRQLCESRRMIKKIVSSLKKDQVPKGRIFISVNPRLVSTVIGQKKSGLEELRTLGYEAKTIADESLENHEFHIISERG